MKKNSRKKTEKYLFLASLFFSLLIGLLLSYNFDFTNNYNFLFESDTARVIGDASNILYNIFKDIKKASIRYCTI